MAAFARREKSPRETAAPRRGRMAAMIDHRTRDGDAAATLCQGCGKPVELCVCTALQPVENRVEVVILQHPQEQDRTLGTAFIAHRQLANSRLVVGLSWPGLVAVLGRPADPRRWGVLYLGAMTIAATGTGAAPPLLRAVAPNGVVVAEQAAVLAALDGIVLLDGSWSQAKALWWRNPWLLKLRRLVLTPPAISLYGALRREPRHDSVSTIEAAAFAVAALQDEEALASRILRPFTLLLDRYRAAGPPPAPPRTDRRRRRR
jgi:DTW domain-containing protein